MLRAYKYRLYPTEAQTRAIDQMLETHRRLYNDALAERKKAWEEQNQSITYSQQSANYTKARRSNEYYRKTNFGSCQRTLKRLDKAFQAFFRRIKNGEKPGYPKFKSKSRFKSIEFTYNDGCKLTDNRLYIQHVGHIRVMLHRPVHGVPKTITIQRHADRYYVSIVCYVESAQPVFPLKSVGLDMGLKHLVVTSGGDLYPAPKCLRESEAEVKRLQRELARRKKGSNHGKETIRKLQRAHEHVANQRRDYAHKVARSLIERYDLIAVEDLNINGMVKNHHMAKSIADASWSTFVSILSFKAEEVGKKVIQVTPNNTSQICSGCGKKVHKSLNVRVHSCPYCGLSLNRDVNAAANILHLALPPARTGPSGMGAEAVSPV